MNKKMDMFEVDFSKININSFCFSEGVIHGSHWTTRISWLMEIANKWGARCFEEEWKRNPESSSFGRPDETTETRQFSTLIFWRHLLKYSHVKNKNFKQRCLKNQSLK